MYFYCYVYVFLLLFILCSVYSVSIVPTGTLRLPWLRFFRAFSSVVRQMPGYNSQRRGTARTLPKLIVLFVCKCVLYYCHRVSTHLLLTNISVSIYLALLGSEAAHGRFSDSHALPPTLRPSVCLNSSRRGIVGHEQKVWGPLSTNFPWILATQWFSKCLPFGDPCPLSSSKQPVDYGRLLDLHALIL